MSTCVNCLQDSKLTTVPLSGSGMQSQRSSFRSRHLIVLKLHRKIKSRTLPLSPPPPITNITAYYASSKDILAEGIFCWQRTRKSYVLPSSLSFSRHFKEHTTKQSQPWPATAHPTHLTLRTSIKNCNNQSCGSISRQAHYIKIVT